MVNIRKILTILKIKVFKIYSSIIFISRLQPHVKLISLKLFTKQFNQNNRPTIINIHPAVNRGITPTNNTLNDGKLQCHYRSNKVTVSLEG
ncbi:hypothetical protein SKA34_12425 [Photobacterium sp. SKA34]|nr:hypothetical protein SKA34_12425 [Photobacterium sp. SKA34]